MTLVSPTQSNPGDEITANSVNDPVNQIANVVNGHIDTTNIDSMSGTKLQAGTVPASAATTDANVETRLSETAGDFVASGCIWSASSGLNGTMTSGVAYVSGKRLTVSSVSSYGFTASRDTYVYVDSSGSIQYSAQTNGASMPSLPSSSLELALVVTGSSSVTSVIDLRSTSPRKDWWQEIGRTTLAVAGDTITVSNLPVRKYLKLLIYTVSSGQTNANIYLNNDTGAEYSWTLADIAGGGAATTAISTTSMPYESGNPASGSRPVGDFTIFNNDRGSEKMVMYMTAYASPGAANAPTISLVAGKWHNVTDYVTRIDLVNGGAGDYAAGSEIVVLGHN